MRIFNEPLYSGTIGSFNSSTLKLDNMFGYAIQIIFTGNPSGTLTLQGSNDSVQISTSPQNWDTITGSSQTITNSGTTTYNVNRAFYNWVRVNYADNSGGTAVGVCNITGNCKGL